jgi:hypothetical protein
MSCAWVTNPINKFGTYLINTGTYPLCNQTGYISNWRSSGVVNYKYGSNIVNQIQPVIYSGISIITSNVNYDPNDYIAEVNNI